MLRLGWGNHVVQLSSGGHCGAQQYWYYHKEKRGYGSRNSLFEECLETNYAKIVGDYETPGVGQCENNNSDCQTRPTNDCGEQWNQASCSLEYNEAYDAVTPQNNVYESLNTVNNSV